VESQLLTFSYQNNDTPIEIAVNLFGFIGLALDVLGAASGLTSSISTREVDYETLKELQSRLHTARSLLEENENELRQLSLLTSSASRNPSFPSLDTNSVYSLEKDNGLSVPVALDARSTDLTAIQGKCEVLRKQVHDARRRLFLHTLLALKSDMHRIVCVELMTFGIQSFFLALILFVCNTQPKLVWISTLVVTTIGILASPFGKTLGLLERAALQKMDEQAAERVIWLDDGDSAFEAVEAREQQRLSKQKKERTLV
jgi:hypothetical protein